MEVSIVILLKKLIPGQKALGFLKVAADMSSLDQSDGYVVYAVWEKGIQPEDPSGYATAVAGNSVYNETLP